MTQQVQGSRDGAPWPAPGGEVDLPDEEANALIQGGAAVAKDHTEDKVLVPPAGIHTPAGTTHQNPSTEMVQAPADAISDPEGTRRAVADAAAGNTTTVSQEVGYQHPDGSALSTSEHAERTKHADSASKPTTHVTSGKHPGAPK
jgi:hypothetical protein